MLTVPAAPLFDIPATGAVVALVAVIALFTTVFPSMFMVPGAELLNTAVKPFVVDVLPPRTQFCTVLLFMLIVAVGSKGVSPRLSSAMIAPAVAEVGLLVI